MKTLVISVLWGPLLVVAAGCGWAIEGNGRPRTEARSVGSFSGVSARNEMDVSATAGEAPTVTLTCDSNLLEHISTRVEDDVLIIGNNNGNETLNPKAVCEAVVTAETLDVAEVYGSGHLTVSELVATPAFSAGIWASGGLAVDGIDASTAVLRVSGSGAARLTGNATTVEARLSSSGGIDARGLVASDATVENSGSGTVEITATDSVHAVLRGTGDIVIYGNPPQQRVEDVGPGSVEFR